MKKFRKKNEGNGVEAPLPTKAVKAGKVRGRKHEISLEPVVSKVSRTEVKNATDFVVPDDYVPLNIYGVDDRLLAYFYTKSEIDAMGGGGGGGTFDPTPIYEELEKQQKEIDALRARTALMENLYDNLEMSYDGTPMVKRK